VLPFVPDDADPWQVVATLRDALAPGSYLAVCHGIVDEQSTITRALQKVYERSVQVSSSGARGRPEILRFFDGFELVGPGLVYVAEWRADGPPPDPADATQRWGLAGIGRKPR
jgi:hypothetical protein